MHVLELILLAAFQGVAEFLPISSSGHLAVLGGLFHWDVEDSVLYSIVLHAGSLLAIVVVYFSLIWNLWRREQWPLVGKIIVGTVPAAVTGVLLKKSGFYNVVCGDLLFIAFAFLITGALLRLTGKPKLCRVKDWNLQTLPWKQVWIMGLVQGVAVLPGISRSGSTIAAGMLSGVSSEVSAAFSFLLALPAIAGAVLLELLDIWKGEAPMTNVTGGECILGFAVSFAVSLVSLWGLMKILKKGKLKYFSCYLFLVGVLIIVWQVVQLMRRA